VLSEPPQPMLAMNGAATTIANRDRSVGLKTKIRVSAMNVPAQQVSCRAKAPEIGLSRK
jgi:hypothetical protein